MCVYLLDVIDAHQIINIKSKNRITYNTIQSKKKNKKKLFFSTKLYKQRIRKDFSRRLVEYSGSWYECPRVLKLAQFLAGESKWFKA